MADVMASACLVGTPCDSSFLTCGRHLWPIRAQAGISANTSREERRGGIRGNREGATTAYQGEGVDEEGAAAVGLDELRDAAGAGAGPHLLLLLLPEVVVQEHAAPARGCCGHLLHPRDAERSRAMKRERRRGRLGFVSGERGLEEPLQLNLGKGVEGQACGGRGRVCQKGKKMRSFSCTFLLLLLLLFFPFEKNAFACKDFADAQ
jgi:hypothetical protein